MVDENYFEKKLVIVEDNLAYTKNRLINADIQIQRIKNLFDNDLEIWNKKVEHLQQIEKNDVARIESLKKKIEAGYVYLDQNSNKAYKTFEGIEKGRIQGLKDATEAKYEKMKSEYEKKLRKKGEVPNYVLEAKIQEAKDKKMLPDEIEELKASIKTPKPVLDFPEGEEQIPQVERELLLLKQKEEKLAKQKEELEAALKERKNISNNFKQIAEDLNVETEEIEKLNQMHFDWIEEYSKEEGGHAIWQGKITKGFKAWLEVKGYKIGG